MDFWTAFPILMEFEGHGVLADHPDDPGGKTKWGITEKVAAEAGYTIKNLTLGQAMAITQTNYWNVIKADELPETIRYAVFDAAFHSGPQQAIKWLQRACRADVDGFLGEQTMSCIYKVDPNVLLSRFCGERLKYLTNLSTFGVFGKGWVRRVADIMGGVKCGIS